MKLPTNKKRSPVAAELQRSLPTKGLQKQPVLQVKHRSAKTTSTAGDEPSATEAFRADLKVERERLQRVLMDKAKTVVPSNCSDDFDPYEYLWIEYCLVRGIPVDLPLKEKECWKA